MSEHAPPAKSEATDAFDRVPPAQRKRVVRIAEAMRRREAAPPMELKLKDGVLQIAFDCQNLEVATLLQMADIGTTDGDFSKGLLGQIACLGAHGRRVDSDNSNFVMAVVRSVKPRDELEALLAAQMGVVHAATMMMARRLNHVETLPQQDSAERALNKLARTFATQMEALKRYRSKGQQVVRVERVTVNEGGQAIVGNVRTGGGHEEK